MTKAELVEVIATKAELTKTDAARALDAFQAAVTGALKKGKKVTLVGFGTFDAKKRPARMGRNPQTGAEVKIPARVVASFKAGSKLKEAIN
ncbi:MAG: HU family DNA-binding protein [Bacilli bacterium]|nr:HU family DNA-binding protein [Bacilli bacterium]MDD4298211.1 HU family DNA-binding protein [Bacilli bacterium]MDD4643476.1 HU family DNA-binding protein [Bacilli bacterium]